MSKIFLTAACVLTLALAVAAAAPKDYYFPEVKVDVTVERDGSFLVDEYRTFEFEGSFSYAYIVIPLRIERLGVRRDIEVSGIAVTDEQGMALRTEIEEDGGRLTAKWFYSAHDERRTFRIHYRVTGGIVSYADVTELYWQAIGDAWDKPARNARVTVILPGPVAKKEELNVWGHGPLAGWAEVVDDRTARFSAPDMASRQFFEIRVVWPAGIVAGVPSDRHTLASIKAEEAGYVQDTIERVRRAQREEEFGRQRSAANKRSFLKALGLWGTWHVVGPLIWLLVYFRVWSAAGKDYRFEGLPDYVREPPSKNPPAIVQTLMREGRTVTPAAFTATLFDLARRGVLEMEDRNVQKKGLFGSKEAVETTVTLKKDLSQSRDLLPYEKALLLFLFDEAVHSGTNKGSSFRVDELQSFLKKKPQKFQAWYTKWTKSIRDEAKPLGFLEPESLKARNLFYAVSLPLAILTLSPVLLIIAVALIPTLKRRTMAWASENESWKGLKRFLDDFSEFGEIPPESYKLWEHYLVFGILFGNAKKILKMLPVILQDDRAAVPVWYAGFSRAGFLTGGGLQSVIGSIEHTATAIHQASTSAAHYSSGGGGGFSGGGGGGGGGG
ncbi:MAG: DUF2207 domain-containing protein, partial [Acidobacteria bacterium]|nr:DUF2207 domain-containing protein [Acidobacteriota bacterium]